MDFYCENADSLKCSILIWQRQGMESVKEKNQQRGEEYSGQSCYCYPQKI